MKIDYVKGDATEPIGEGKKLICHCCNDIGGWGSGFVVALSKKWDDPEIEYRRWANDNNYNKPFMLGQVQYVRVERDIAVANMIGQSGVGGFHELSPIRYGAIEECLIRIREAWRVKKDFSLHCPRFGAGLAGGDWDSIEHILERVFKDEDINITVYDYEPTN